MTLAPNILRTLFFSCPYQLYEAGYQKQAGSQKRSGSERSFTVGVHTYISYQYKSSNKHLTDRTLEVDVGEVFVQPVPVQNAGVLG